MTNIATTTYHYCVAGFTFSVELPAGKDADALLPSFRPFVCRNEVQGDWLLGFTATAGGSHDLDGRLIEESESDMGLVRLYAIDGGYGVAIASTPGGTFHTMTANSDFTAIDARIDWSDRYAGHVVTSMLRIAYSQAVLLHDAISLHASAVACDGKAYLFMGRSGTGKSTHSVLWLKHVPGCELLNDDNPTVRLIDGGSRAMAFGTPWSGKTPCYKQLAMPVGGMVRLNQAPANRFHRCDGVEAFMAIFPGCSVIAGDERLRNGLYDTLARLSEVATVGTLECLPDADAALLCHAALAGCDLEKNSK